jgi:hypothetical protein
LQIKSALGISTTSKGNNYIIQDILTILEKLDLIRCRRELRKDGTEFKTLWVLEAVNLHIDTPTYEGYEDRVS